MKTNVPTSIDLSLPDWKVIESLSGQTLEYAPKVKVRLTDEDRVHVEWIMARYAGQHQGLRPSMGDAVRLALYAAREGAMPVYYVNVSQLLRDVLAWYARQLGHGSSVFTA